MSRDVGYLIDRGQKRFFVGLRGFAKTADLSHELERRSANLFGCNWRVKVIKSFDIPAHAGKSILTTRVIMA